MVRAPKSCHLMRVWVPALGPCLLTCGFGDPVGEEYCVTLCDLGVFMDQAAEAVSAQDAQTGHVARWVCAPAGRVLLQRPVRPMDVVVAGVLAQDKPQVPFPGDQHPVQAFTADTGDPALRDRVRTRRPDRGLDDPRTGRSEHRIEGALNLASRSRIKNFRPSVRSPRFISRLRACWVTHSPVG
jgi:hypothetical protein